MSEYEIAADTWFEVHKSFKPDITREAHDAICSQFESLKEMVANLRAALPPLTEEQSQMVGLYLLNAVRLGEGSPFTTSPTLHGDTRPRFRVIHGGAA